jgi:protein-S-isoprenylcysteine O-methyltransferase Ste14
MDNPRLLIALAVVAGIALLVVGGVYFAEPARSLPSFFPGHSADSSAHHIKHGIAAVAVAAALFVFAWFASGPRRASIAR